MPSISESVEHLARSIDEIKRDRIQKEREESQRHAQNVGKLSAIETTLADLKVWLRGGDGQEGEIENMNARLDKLQTLANKLLGAIAALGAILALIEGLHGLRMLGLLH